jgi:8-amino-3,8-dideoxy-alpha-D-manno-octulosonate transaminase
VVAENENIARILAGNFTGFQVNNWHYQSKWDHLKNAITSLNHVHIRDVRAARYSNTSANKDFSASDAVMSRCIRFPAISLLWTQEQDKTKGEQMINVINKLAQFARVRNVAAAAHP